MSYKNQNVITLKQVVIFKNGLQIWNHNVEFIKVQVKKSQ